jgi:hypothetical protein
MHFGTKNYLKNNHNHAGKLVQKLVLLFLERAHQVETAACLS